MQQRHDADRGPAWAWLLQTLATLAWFSGGTSSRAAPSSKGAAASGNTYQERTFSDTHIAGKKVTCDDFEPAYYPTPIFTCKNMRVDGRRLRYWAGPGVPGNYHCGIQMNQWKARNDLGALCHCMMDKQSINHKLWAAVVSEASCKISPGTRLLFVKEELPNVNTSSIGQSMKRSVGGPIEGASYAWEEFEEGRGYVVTFRCMMLAE